METTHPEESDESLRAQEESPSVFICFLTRSIDVRAHLGSKIAQLEITVQELRHELAASQRAAAAASQREESLNEIIQSLGAKERTSSVSIATVTHVSLKFTSIRY